MSLMVRMKVSKKQEIFFFLESKYEPWKSKLERMKNYREIIDFHYWAHDPVVQAVDTVGYGPLPCNK